MADGRPPGNGGSSSGGGGEPGPYWSLMFEVSESAEKPVAQEPVALAGGTWCVVGPGWPLYPLFHPARAPCGPSQNNPKQTTQTNKQRPAVVLETLAGAVATGLVAAGDEVVSLYHRRLEHGAYGVWWAGVSHGRQAGWLAAVRASASLHTLDKNARTRTSHDNNNNNALQATRRRRWAATPRSTRRCRGCARAASGAAGGLVRTRCAFF
jgi:hypothetical protein